MIRLHHGQGYDIFWRDSNTCPTEEDYIKMVTDSTDALQTLPNQLESRCFPDLLLIINDQRMTTMMMAVMHRTRDRSQRLAVCSD